MAELRPAVCQAAGEQGMLGWLLRRLKVTVVNQCLLSLWYYKQECEYEKDPLSYFAVGCFRAELF